MDCQAPVLGHSALRCAGLSRSQTRLQVLPATLYLIGFLLIAGTWIKLALARRIFPFRLVFLLSLCGFLDFILALIGVNSTQDGAPSSALGGMASLICLFQLLAIYLFLPSIRSLPGFLDRLLASFFTSSVILDILSSVYHWQGHFIIDPDRRIIVYAEAACLIIFYACSIGASQFHRYFAVVRHEREPPVVTPPMSLFPTVTFLAALVFFIAQSCIAFSFFGSFAAVMTASMFSALGYVLLVATFILENMTQDTAKPIDITIMPPVPSNPEDPQMVEKDIKFDTVAASNPPSRIDFNTISHPVHSQRSRSASNVMGSEAGSVIWIGHAAPRAENYAAKTGASSRPRRSTRIYSGLSMTSWDRVQHLMRKKMATRPMSGLTYYGSESSYPEGVQTRRSSMMSSFAQAVTGYGPSSLQVPPVPAIDPRHLASSSQLELGFAQPLNDGEEPIPLSRVKTTEPLNISPKQIKPIEQTKQTKHSSLKAALTSLFRSPVSSPTKVEEIKEQPQNRTSSGQDTSNGSVTTLPTQYQSAKLFPATEWQKEVEEVRVSSPHASEVKHSGSTSESLNGSQEIDVADSSYTYVNSSDGQSPNSASSRKVKVVRKISMAEDRAVNMTASIIFPSKV